jgi:hypothetical protein
MHEHSKFEELCALAVTGQISPEDLNELEAHLKACETCRRAQADFVEIESLWLSPAPDPASHFHEIGSTMNQRILRRMQSAGARFSKPALKEIGRESPWVGIFGFRSLSVPAYAAGALALIAIGVAVGIEISTHRTTPALENGAGVVSERPTPGVPSAVRQRDNADRELIAAQQSAERLNQKLTAAEAERSRTLVRLEQAERQLVALKDSNESDAAEIATLRAATDQARMEVADVRTQLAKLKEVQSSKDADLVAAVYRAHEAEDKLAEQSASIERERQLLGAGREIRDIIGARNLHIVDVADVGGGGVKKPFGRVFYTEGKSLIFYAYDLDKPKGKQAFYAWGHREGDPHSTRMLGLIYNDDQAQKRWAFKFDDPKVLAEIDSVFVTLEPNDKPGESPKGKKLLKAFLGTPPNHP